MTSPASPLIQPVTPGRGIAADEPAPSRGSSGAVSVVAIDLTRFSSLISRPRTPQARVVSGERSRRQPGAAPRLASVGLPESLSVPVRIQKPPRPSRRFKPSRMREGLMIKGESTYG
jgi:hypothetical protein